MCSSAGLHAKRRAVQRFGVCVYIFVCVHVVFECVWCAHQPSQTIARCIIFAQLCMLYIYSSKLYYPCTHTETLCACVRYMSVCMPDCLPHLHTARQHPSLGCRSQTRSCCARTPFVYVIHIFVHAAAPKSSTTHIEQTCSL